MHTTSTILTPTRNPMKRLYNWVLHWAQTPYGILALAILAFAESSFFPVPPDVLLIALCMGAHRRWVIFATTCAVASLLGGWAGYGIGYFLSNSLGEVLLQWVGILTVGGGAEWASSYGELADNLQPLLGNDAQFIPIIEELRRIAGALTVTASYELNAAEKALWLRSQALTYFHGPWGAWAVGIAAFTPIPYKVFTITSGMFHMDFIPFTVASALGRSGRFFSVAALIGLTYRYFGDRIQQFIDRYFNWLAIAFAILLLGGFVVLKYL